MRLDEELWLNFGAKAEIEHTDRSAVVREFADRFTNDEDFRREFVAEMRRRKAQRPEGE